MRKLSALLVAVPSFLLGSLVVATLTTTAKGQLALPNEFKDVPRATERWDYKVVSDTELNVYGQQGYEYCGESAAVINGVAYRTYTIRRRQ